MDGILNIDKPAGITSHDVVFRVRRILKMKRVGHAGTLDPGATGVLVVCLGQAARVSEYLMGQEKEYRAVLVLGEETTTEDAEGEVVSSQDCSNITPEDVKSVLPSFVGEIMQVPPMVSAVHYKGKRLYELARKNQVVEREARVVKIYDLQMISFVSGAHPHVELNVTCGKGTYIRTLCADIGRKLGCGGHMASLSRTRVGNFLLENAVSLEALENLAREGKLKDVLISIDRALSEMPAVQLNKRKSLLIRNGVVVPTDVTIEAGKTIRIHDESGSLIALGRVVVQNEDERKLRPEKVFSLEKDVADKNG